MDDVEIEVFRADTRASRGITAEHLAEVAAFDCDANPVPNVLGHPAGDKPAIDRVRGFRVEGSSLFAKVPATAKAIWEGIKKGEILNRSMAFFSPDHEANPTPGKWAPRHLGWLGGAAPGIPGMTPLQEVAKGLAFAADGDTLEILGAPAAAVVYSPAPTAVVTVFEAKEPAMSGTNPNPDLDAAFQAREDDLKAREDRAAARIRTAFTASNNAALDALVREGKVLPAEVEDLKTTFAALDPEAEELTFGAADKTTKATPAAKLLAFMAGLPKRVPTGDRLSPDSTFEANPAPTARDAQAEAAELTGKARKLMAERPGLTFEAAIEELSGS